MTTLRDAATLVSPCTLVPAGTSADAGAAIRFDRVHTDTRTLRAGDLFVALAGERFDAHAFLPQARAAGAVAAIASHGLAEAGLAGLQVPDTLAALQQLATGWRARFRGPVIAVTGSNGKTTVTQMVATILRAAHGERAHATAGNLNNHIGVPLTVLRLTLEGEGAHAASVIELGMNHPGEIAQLAAIAQPTVALVNNAQREHQEFMATVEAVARENGASIEALPADGTAVFPANDAYAALWRALAGARRCWRFALAEDGVAAEVTGAAQWVDGAWRVSMFTPHGPATVRLRIAGRHNVRNALAATAATLAAGVPLDAVVRGLEAFEPVKGRSQLKSLRSPAGGAATPLVDDTYNANPDSVRAAIDVLAELPGPRWLVLGDMGEVGDQGPAFHEEIGAYAAERGIDALWCAGALSAHAARACGPTARHFADAPALIAALGASLQHAPAFAAVLVKGSRFMAMERVVAALQDAALASATKNNDADATTGGPDAA
jgi:UDP-N-acetylmuramoyl-tripeptide--D-alanyl-D-alanine ligase